MAGEAGLLLLAWALGRWLDISPADRLHANAGALILGVSATLPLLLGLHWTLTAEAPSLRRLVDLVVQQLGRVLAGRSVLELAMLAALAGIAEEALFRGVVQVGLSRLVSDGGALVIASALFGLAHFVTPAYAALGCVAGLYLGGLFLVQGNLLVPMTAHALYDFVALLHVVRRYRMLQAVPPQNPGV